MKQDKSWLETAAATENQWVRAVILRKDHVAHREARRIAVDATGMAKKALGSSHPQYAVALLNLGIYYETVEQNHAEAARRYRQALRILGNDHPEYSEALYWLGTYQFSEGNSKARAMEVWSESLAALRRRSGNPLRIADLLVCLSCCFVNDQPKKATPLLQEALEIQRKRLRSDDAIVKETETRLAAALRAAAEVE
jgi:tetratricopeptide (TPR) repeat protein